MPLVGAPRSPECSPSIRRRTLRAPLPACSLCYRRVKSLAWYCMGTLISIIRPLIMGGMQLGVLQRVGPEVQALVDAMAACCRGLAGVIVTDAPFGECASGWADWERQVACHGSRACAVDVRPCDGRPPAVGNYEAKWHALRRLPARRLVDRFNELDSCWYALTAGMVALDLADASEPELYAVSMLTGVLRQLAGRVSQPAFLPAAA
jgi:hypothetical protein